MMNWRIAALHLGAALAASLSPLAATAGDLDSLKPLVEAMRPGGWNEIPGSSIQSVLAPREATPFKGGPVGPSAVIAGRNGAAFDGRRWYFHGGGLGMYSGNEIYAFDFATQKWSRLTEPSPLAGGGQCPDTANGAPRSSQVHDGIAYVAKTQSLWLWPTAHYCPEGDLAQTDLWEYRLAAKQWQKRASGIPGGPYKTAVDPASGHVYVVDRTQIREFDPLAANYVRSSPAGNFLDRANAEYDPKRKKLWLVTERHLLAADVGGAGPIGAYQIVAPLPGLDGVGPVGIAYHPGRDVLVLWAGGGQVATFAPDAAKWTVLYDAPGATPDATDTPVFSKFVYLAEIDAFAGFNNPEQGVWLYRLPGGARATPAVAAGGAPNATQYQRRICPGPKKPRSAECTHYSVKEGLRSAENGDVIFIAPGVYNEAVTVNASDLLIFAEPGAHLRGKASNGKAALVITGNNTTIIGLECSEIAVSGGNGACIRQEGRNLTLRRVFFHHSQMGILAGDNKGDIVIEDSRFEDMVGYKSSLGHSIYVGRTESLVVRRTKVLRTAGLGHGVKSRAIKSVLEGNLIASINSANSRAIDMSAGGDVTIRNNLIQQGAESDNDDLIAIGLESQHANVTHATLIEGNTVVCDRPKCVLVSTKSPGLTVVKGNRLIGPIALTGMWQSSAVKTDGNDAKANRSAAGLKPFPALPELPR
jgi:hypothetical protein